MPWNKNDYPASMKNLDPKVREKAIEIANALLRDHYEEGRAISIAIAQAHEYVEGKSEGRPHYEVKPRESEWILTKASSDHVLKKESTKSELLTKAKEYVTKHDGILSIYHADGSYENTLYE
ncbi:hypothetical protein DV702_00575 [Sporosarcina sp. PTS2304]|uniref:hypothetical protein n=1 Tax=Sporosarcina sp. PTS2304 TaxID=2283194 RepID=UPI000E0D4938|nr:hypothetical protein [Sporosarcina sp. PTS2304]AXH98328.1 hypothetical protein DV702_00575 [Sporosarcina sp. PTS2304]